MRTTIDVNFIRDDVAHDPSSGRFTSGTNISKADHVVAKRYHEGQHAEHAKSALAAHQNLDDPPKGSHAHAALMHENAAFNHGKAAAGGKDAKYHARQAVHYSGLANTLSGVAR